MHEAKDIETVHTKFLRRLLLVNKSTNLASIYGELGRYLFLKQDTDLGRHYNGKNWASYVKSLLDNHGLSYLWYDQFFIDVNFNVIKCRILDNYKQKWYSDINNSPRLQSYSLFKHEFIFETYLDSIKKKHLRIALTRFRTSSHSLMIEIGRYENLSREQRKCRSCNLNVLENEFHFI